MSTHTIESVNDHRSRRGLALTLAASASKDGRVTEAEIPKRLSKKAEQRAETMEMILDAAEALFAQHGLNGVALKDVAKAVGVHHTLLNYYFADKKALFDMVFARRAHITSERRMKALDDYDAATRGKPTVEGALRAFLDTDLDLYIEGGERWKNYAQLTAQVANTPEWGAELMDEHFDPVVLRLIGLLQSGTARLRRGRHLLGLSLRDGSPLADAGAHGSHRQAVGRPVPVRRLRRGEAADGLLHGSRLRERLQVTVEINATNAVRSHRAV